MPEAQHATTLCGNVLEPCARKCYVRPVMKALRLLNLGSAEAQRRSPHGKWHGRKSQHHSCSVQIPLLMSKGCMPAARNLSNYSALESCAGTSREKILQPVGSALQRLGLQTYNSESRTANDGKKKHLESCADAK